MKITKKKLLMWIVEEALNNTKSFSSLLAREIGVKQEKQETSKGA